MNTTPQKISVLLPVMNEEDNILPLVERLVPVLESVTEDYEIIFVDDGSKDNTAEKILTARKSNTKIVLIKLSRNFGQHFAAQAAFDYCHGDRIVWMDADLQEPPEAIISLLNKMDEGYDVVYGVRKSLGGPLFKRMGSLLYIYVFNKLVKHPQPMNASVMRVLNRKCVEAINKMPERVRFITALNSWVGFKWAGVEIDYHVRRSGKTKYNFSKRINNALDAILSFTMIPLKFISIVGFFISLLSIAFSLCILLAFITKIWTAGVVGWTTIVVSLFFLGGVQMMCLGLIGEYIGRIYFEVKARPLYIIDSITD